MARSLQSHLVASCPDIVLHIMRASSPVDLASLGLICRRFKCILDSNPSTWQYSRDLLDLPAPPVGWIGNERPPGGLLQYQSHPSQDERSYADYIFGGGACTVCGTWTTTFPCSFALGFRSCSDDCRKRVFQLKRPLLVKLASPLDLKRYPGVQWLVPHLIKDDAGLYFCADVEAVKNEMDTLRKDSESPQEFHNTNALATVLAQCRLRSFRALEAWIPQYMLRVAHTRRKNIRFLKVIATHHSYKIQTLLMSPTLHRVFMAFNRDLTRMGSNDWRLIASTVLTELR